MARAVIIGGTGAIGRATARRLLATDWSVGLTGRDPARMPRDIAAAGGQFIAADAGDDGQLRAAFGDGADLLVDCVCFTAEDAARLLPLARDTASTVLISSKAVYVDAAGVDHPTAAANIAALIDLAAARPGRRILNAADPDAPSALEISRVIARYLGHDWDEVLLDDQQATPGQLTPGQPIPGQPAPGQLTPGQLTLGRHPWDRPHPLVLDMTAAAGLGYTPAGDYAATVAAEVDWLIAAARGGEDADLIPGPEDEYFAPLLDYGSEDRWLAAQTASAG